ncbi:MAG TPA: ATP-binding protein [Hyphomicrobiaceae bacterium]|nr:ATP-binding protein [Hyphomicrobiaceae bacterium]
MTPTASRFFDAPASAISAADEARFFSAIRLANGTFKTTAAGRMRDLDALLARCAHDLRLLAPAVLDVAVSSGVTTAELGRALADAGLRPAITATDLAIEARLVEVARGVRVLQDSAGRDLQYDIAGVPIRPWARRLDYVTGYRLLSMLARRLCRNNKDSPARSVQLISRRIDDRSGISFVEDDLIRPNPQFERRFDIVRAANVLNRDYFDHTALSAMISNLIAYLRGPGALLVLNRTHLDGSNHGSICRLEPSGTMLVVARIGRGSEVEETALPPAA